MQHREMIGVVRDIFYDGCRFIQRNNEIFSLSPMHIYYSALAFTPRDTELFRDTRACMEETWEWSMASKGIGIHSLLS